MKRNSTKKKPEGECGDDEDTQMERPQRYSATSGVDQFPLKKRTWTIPEDQDEGGQSGKKSKKGNDDDYSDEEEDARERMAAGLEKSWEDVLEHVEGAMVEFGHAGKSTVRLRKAIFALAALSVFCFPQRPAHWAFWAKNSRWTTARLVNEVIGECLACPLCRSHPTDKNASFPSPL